MKARVSELKSVIKKEAAQARDALLAAQESAGGWFVSRIALRAAQVSGWGAYCYD